MRGSRMSRETTSHPDHGSQCHMAPCDSARLIGTPREFSTRGFTCTRSVGGYRPHPSVPPRQANNKPLPQLASKAGSFQRQATPRTPRTPATPSSWVLQSLRSGDDGGVTLWPARCRESKTRPLGPLDSVRSFVSLAESLGSDSYAAPPTPLLSKLRTKLASMELSVSGLPGSRDQTAAELKRCEGALLDQIADEFVLYRPLLVVVKRKYESFLDHLDSTIEQMQPTSRDHDTLELQHTAMRDQAIADIANQKRILKEDWSRERRLKALKKEELSATIRKQKQTALDLRECSDMGQALHINNKEMCGTIQEMEDTIKQVRQADQSEAHQFSAIKDRLNQMTRTKDDVTEDLAALDRKLEEIKDVLQLRQTDRYSQEVKKRELLDNFNSLTGKRRSAKQLYRNLRQTIGTLHRIQLEVRPLTPRPEWKEVQTELAATMKVMRSGSLDAETKEEEEAAAKRLRAAQLEPKPEPGQSRRPGPRGAPGLSLLELPDKETRSALFQRMDYNGNGGLSLAEIDKAVVELYPEFDHKRALMRALKAADASGDGFIGRSEFRRLLHCEQLAPLPVLHFCGNRGRAPETSCLPACLLLLGL